MVDVMLVLLVIFMVAAPLLEQGIEVHLPKAATGQSFSDSSPVITLDQKRTIYFNKSVVSLKELRRKLAGLKSGQPIVIRVDKSARVKEMMELWDLCRDAGFPQVRITTLPE